MKIIYLDTETTGLGDNAAIVQLSGIVEIDGEAVEVFNLFGRPHEGADISEEALNIQGRKLEEVEACPFSSNELHFNFLEILDKYINRYDKSDKFIVAGYNVEFDVNKLRELFQRNNHKYLFSYIDHRKLDPLHWVLPLQLLGKIPQLENNKLETWCRHFNIDLKAHDSLEDIKATRELIMLFIDKMN
ncbi:MAG: 3'-5' exonuclease [Fusobacteriaceae bacterium]